MKLKSRKFWLAVASFLASIGASIAGLASDNKYVVTAGMICTVLSTAIYQVCESLVDAAAAGRSGDVRQDKAD